MPIYNWEERLKNPLPPATVYDLDTGEEIKEVFWVNTEHEVLERVLLNVEGKPYAIEGQIVRVQEHRRVRIEFDNRWYVENATN